MRQEEKDYLFNEKRAEGNKNATQEIYFLMKELKGYKKLKNEVKGLEKENTQLKIKLDKLGKKLIVKDISKPEKVIVEREVNGTLLNLKRLIHNMDKTRFYTITDINRELLMGIPDARQNIDFLISLNLIEVKKERGLTKYRLK